MEQIALLHPVAQVTAIIMIGLVVLAFVVFVLGRAVG